MAKKLTDEQIKDIVARRAEGQSYAKIAKKYKISANTVKNYCNNEAEFAEICTHKKIENEKTVLKHMEEKSGEVCNLIDQYIKALSDPERIKKSNVKDVATALGIMIDKFVKADNSEDLKKLDEVLKKMGGNI